MGLGSQVLQGYRSGSGVGFASPDQTIVGTSSASPTNTVGSGGILALQQFRAGLGGVTEGQISLLTLDTLIIVLLLFYWWTKDIQGG